MQLVDSFTPSELFTLAESLSKLLILGPWIVETDYCYRPVAGRHIKNDKAKVWHSEPGKYGDPTYCQEPGWYWEIGIGVVGLSRVANYKKPLQTAQAAMDAVDSILASCKAVVLVPSDAANI